MKEEEIKKLGYEAVAKNLYIKDDSLYIQHKGEMKKASDLTEKEVRNVSSYIAYENEMKKIGGTNELSKSSKEPTPTKDKKTTTEIVLRGSEDDITRVIKARRMDLIIEASKDKKHPGKGILYYDEPGIGEEPSVALVDMITADMGDIETDVVLLEEKHHVNQKTGFIVDTYCAIVRATDKATGASGLGTTEENINWDEWTRANNPKSFALTKAIRKAERNAKEIIIPVPRKVIVTLVKKMIAEHIKNKKD